MLWCALIETVPLYPFYALLFVENGLSERQITALFALWSLVAIVAEVPCGALADRVSHRAALAGTGGLQAAAYAVWMIAPGMAGFAAGFVLWGLSGALAGGAFPALVHDALRAAGAEQRLAGVLSRAEAVGWAVQVPLAAVATALFAAGGYTAVGIASIVTGLTAAAMALRLGGGPAAAGGGEGDEAGDDTEEDEAGYLALLRGGVHEAATSGGVRGLLVAVAALAMLDAVEEYTPLLASAWGVEAAAVPAWLLAIPLAGAAGAAAGARLERARPGAAAVVAVAGALAFAGAVAAGAPAGILAVAAYFGLGKALQVVADVRLQHAITGPARATVTAVAGTAAEVASLGLFALWALGGAAAAALAALASAPAVAWILGRRRVAALRPAPPAGPGA